MSYTTLELLVEDLKLKSQVQTSDGFSNPEVFESLVKSAGKKHNSSYVITGASCTVPSLEHDAVVYLAWAELCVIRASMFAAAPSTNAQGFGTNRDTPYYKLMDLSKELRVMYKEACEAIGLSSFYGSGAITQSEVTVESIDLGAQAPLEMSATPPSPVITTTPSDRVNGDGTIVVNWTTKDFSNFEWFAVVFLQGASAIYQDWNWNSTTGIPRLNNSATVLGRINRMDIRSVKLENLTATTGTVNRFLVVLKTKSGKYAYSNEVAITQP